MSFVQSLVRQFSGASSSIETVEQKFEKERRQRLNDFEQLKQTREAYASYQSAGLSLQDELLRSAQQKLARQPSHGSERSFERTGRSRESSFEIVDLSRDGSFHEIDPADLPADEFFLVDSASQRVHAERAAMVTEDVDAYRTCVAQLLGNTVAKPTAMSSLAIRYTNEWIDAAILRMGSIDPAPAIYIKYKKVEPVVTAQLARKTVGACVVEGLRSAVTTRREHAAMLANDFDVPPPSDAEKHLMQCHDADVAGPVFAAQALEEEVRMQTHDLDAPLPSTAVAAKELSVAEQDAAIKLRDSTRAAEELREFYNRRKLLQRERFTQNRCDEREKAQVLALQHSWRKVLQLIDSPDSCNAHATYASVPAPMTRMFKMLQGYAA
ncbi:hypothetical protein ACHHYP_01215 [Achlya hypogyna]|uniref:Uncharacterized protein n=1 Tax=Achlya hypogyna TaxID=1202772 RepID=A0A1V9Z9D4_ACHHY|nr:hypothetical protein ACHHYP_01215 [Achlya hypogyna]